MEAGRELDALVAEKVMGWTGCRDSPYSTDIVVAWRIIEKFGFMIHPTGHGREGKPAGYWVGYPRDGHSGLVGDMDNDTVAFAETAPLAICLAALKAAEALTK